MKIKKGAIWIRSEIFEKYFATAFGVASGKDIVTLTFGDEKTVLPDKQEAYVADGQIKMTLESFDALIRTVEAEKKKLIKEGKLPLKKETKKN